MGKITVLVIGIRDLHHNHFKNNKYERDYKIHIE